MKAPEEVETKGINGAAELEEAKPSAATESVPAVVQDAPRLPEEEQVAAAPAASNEQEKEVVVAPPSEEESGKSIDVESVVPEKKPVDMEIAPPTNEERTVLDSEMTPAVDTPSETLETPVSDKKRPLEKENGEDDDDREHSPDAKQPRIFSPDKVSHVIEII